MSNEMRSLTFSNCTPISYDERHDSNLLCKTQDGEEAYVTLGQEGPVVKAVVTDKESGAADLFFQYGLRDDLLVSMDSYDYDAGVCYLDSGVANMTIDPKEIMSMKADAAKLTAEIGRAEKFFATKAVRETFLDDAMGIKGLLSQSAVIVSQMLRSGGGLQGEALRTVKGLQGDLAGAMKRIDALISKDTSCEANYEGFRSYSSFMDGLVDSKVLNPFERAMLFRSVRSKWLARSLMSNGEGIACGDNKINYTNPLNGDVIERPFHYYCGGGGCFDAGTKVLMENGAKLSMSELAGKFSDGNTPAIATFNESSGNVEYVVPSSVIVHSADQTKKILDVKYCDDDGKCSTVSVTDNHPLSICEDGGVSYVPAGEIALGAGLCSGVDFETVSVESITPRELGANTVYDIHFDSGNHNYLVADENGLAFVAHNKMY
jgi:hypothetical protein